MQATQSSNAEGKRAFPSPFTAPIQAARRLMEGQREDEEHSESKFEGLLEPASLAVAERPDGLTGAWRGQIRYDEAAIVASLDAGLESAEAAGFEDGLDPGHDFQIGDVTPGKPVQPFGKPPFVSLGLDFRGNRGPDLRWDRGPDPGAVRAAISRLARESQRRELQNKEPAAPKDAAAFADAVAFADVARRVWSEADTESAASPPGKDTEGNGSDLSGGPSLAYTVESAATCPTGEISADGPLSATSGAYAAAPGNAVISGNPALSIETGISDLLSSRMLLGETESVESKEASVLSAPERTVASGRSSEEGECLAHDAGNLLSAMRLYSELLCISGVLQERHRHYAEDLKLLATRSQRLIDRLLKLGERLADGRPVAHAADDADAQSGARIAGQTLNVNGEGRKSAPVEAALRSSEVPQTPFDDPGSIEDPGLEIAPNLIAEDARLECTNVAAVLERMGNVLHTISHGALRIDLESNNALPVAIGLEPLERILVNLVSNATAAVQANGGAIRVRATVQEGSEAGKSGPNRARILVLTVDDSGCGMSATQIREALGERDAESLPVQEASTRPGRRGLGLRIVRELVESSGGRLFIQSQPGTGTRIEIHWQTLGPSSMFEQSSPATLSVGTLPAPEGFDPAVSRKPVGVSGTGVSRASVQSNSVSRIRAGAVAGDEGAVAC